MASKKPAKKLKTGKKLEAKKATTVSFNYGTVN